MTTVVAEEKKKAAKDVKVKGVILKKVDRDVILKFLHTLDIQASEEEASDKLVTRLADYFNGKFEESELAECDNCEGGSDMSLPVCPFCGVGEAVDEEPAVKVEDKKKGKKGDAMHAHVNGTSKGAIVKASAADMRKHTGDEAKLDEAVREVSRLKAGAAVSYWQLGKKIGEIIESQIWKARKDDDGKPHRFKSFEAFCTNELNMSPKNAHQLADTAEKFSEKEVGALGHSRLTMLLQAPESERGAIKEKIEKGATYRETKEEVKKARAKAGVGKGESVRGTKRARKDVVKARGAATKLADKKPSEKIVVANMLGRKKVKLFKGPVQTTDEELVAARRVSEQPWGRMELENGVVQLFKVSTSPAGELYVEVTTKRES